MGISIQQAQALLAGQEGVFGQQRDDVGVSLQSTDSYIIGLGANFVRDARDNLNKADRTASGSLETSIVPTLVEFGNGVNIIEIRVNDYYKFVDAGVQGLKGGRSTKGYKFRYLGVSKKMANALAAYITSEGLSIRNTEDAVSSRERKRKGIQTSPLMRAAVRMGLGIKRKGLKPSGFWTDAITELERDIATGIGNALRIDVIEIVSNPTP